MRIPTHLCLPAVAGLSCAMAWPVAGSTINVSLGVRETGDTSPIGGDGGIAGSIEWVDLDGQTLVLDGTWQQFTWDLTPNNTNLTGFTGDGLLDGAGGTIEHLRLDSNGEAGPYQLFIDDVVYTPFGGGAEIVQDFEGFTDGDEVTFQEPGFSGSTSDNIADGSTSAVSSAMAFSGAASYEVNYAFVDDDPARWLRLTTFAAANSPDPIVGFNGQLSVYIKGIPEPGSLSLLGLGTLALLRRQRS